MHGFSEMVWATMGPPGELFDQAMQHDFSAVVTWLETQCERGALDPKGSASKFTPPPTVDK